MDPDWSSVGWTTIWPIGAFPTKYVLERSPMIDSNADSAHCKIKKVNREKIQKKKRKAICQRSPCAWCPQIHKLSQENATQAFH